MTAKDDQDSVLLKPISVTVSPLDDNDPVDQVLKKMLLEQEVADLFLINVDNETKKDAV